MVARRKKPARAPRIAVFRPWDDVWAKLLLAGDGWTPPDQVKIIHGVRSGTVTAIFKDEKGHHVEAYSRFRMTATGALIEVTEQGLRKSFSWSLKGAAK